MPLILGTNSIKDTGFNVANSCRFDSSSSSYLSRTINLTQNSTSQHKFTISCWFKLGKTGQSNGEIFGAHGSNDYFAVRVQSSNKIDIISYDNAIKGRLTTTQLLRDHSTWYHIIVACDSNNASGTNRMRLYLNGSEVTDFSTDINPSTGADIIAENMDEFNIGRNIDQVGGAGLFDGYITEFVYIDNDQLEPSYFGEFDEDTGIWKPKDLSGLSQLSNTFSFYLDFEDSSNLGNDVSGNNLDFTSNNLTSIDQSTDTCTNNFATGNPIASQSGSAQSNSLLTFSEGNLLMADNSETGIANFGLSSGKWFWEVKVIADQDGLIIGACNEHFNINAELGYNSPASATGAKAFGYYGGNGTATVSVDDGSGFGSYGSAIAVNNIVSVALDLDSADQSCTFYLNGSSQGALDITNLSSGESYFPAVGNWSVSDVSTSWNFGSPQYSESGGNSDGNGYGNFSMAVPSGYYALNTKNLAEYG